MNEYEYRVGRVRVDGEWEGSLRGVGVNVVDRVFCDVVAVVDIDFEEEEDKGSWLRTEGG